MHLNNPGSGSLKQIFKPIETSKMNMDSGEGSSSKTYQNESSDYSSKVNQNETSGGRVITLADYSFHSDNEDQNNNYSPNDSGSEVPNVSQILYQSPETFEKTVTNHTNSGIEEMKEDLNKVKQQYLKDNVPASKEQVAEIEKKLNICDKQIAENLQKEQEEAQKGKGKEVFNSNK
jgi:hypothetical protein